MFIGHFGLALAAKKVAPTVSLGTLFVAAQLADLAWPLLVLAGVERFEIRPGITAVTPLDFVHYPWSHSLAALLVWGIAFGLVYRLARGASRRTGWTIAALVVSHWVLDVVTHRPDMPLAPGDSHKLGLGLWNSMAATVVVEVTLFLACLAVYLHATRAVDRIGRYALAGLVAFLLAVYVANLVGPPPPSVNAVAVAALAMWLLVAWGYWIDRHRVRA
jgi:membrane-bound metal-dependent hydrolase YbcI (DUF457 family)